MIGHIIKKYLFLCLAFIYLVLIEEKMIEDEEELVRWIPVEKLETSKIFFCETYSDEDLFRNLNNDTNVDEMKKKVNEVYSLQNKKRYKKNNKVKNK